MQPGKTVTATQDPGLALGEPGQGHSFACSMKLARRDSLIVQMVVPLLFLPTPPMAIPRPIRFGIINILPVKDAPSVDTWSPKVPDSDISGRVRAAQTPPAPRSPNVSLPTANRWHEQKIVFCPRCKNKFKGLLGLVLPVIMKPFFGALENLGDVNISGVIIIIIFLSLVVYAASAIWRNRFYYFNRSGYWSLEFEDITASNLELDLPTFFSSLFEIESLLKDAFPELDMLTATTVAKVKTLKNMIKLIRKAREHCAVSKWDSATEGYAKGAFQKLFESVYLLNDKLPDDSVQVRRRTDIAIILQKCVKKKNVGTFAGWTELLFRDRAYYQDLLDSRFPRVAQVVLETASERKRELEEEVIRLRKQLSESNRV
ncbi:hypothetical protein BDP27DRAFT_1361169 [Rhodocollybia butyracea]|uniref:Uncharacterized protein n=1 Tax=Rhodocollybia butyracea TaxID=206335 RepID=A0A9P5PZN6_9AGAR|nr:hypothetical protein BDP27DRAFT_1361169 [Rhodocollybia butyracea]